MPTSSAAGVTKNTGQRARGRQPRQHRKHHAVRRFESGPVYLAAQHHHLVAQHRYFHLLGPTAPRAGVNICRT